MNMAYCIFHEKMVVVEPEEPIGHLDMDEFLDSV